MTSTVLTTARPIRAAIAWATRDAIFCEYPTPAGVPYIVRYPLTLDGITRALNIMIEHSDPTPRQPSATQDHPAVKKPKATAWATDEQRAKTREVLAKLKLV